MSRFVAAVQTGGEQPVHVLVLARTAELARERLVDQYGADAIVSVRPATSDRLPDRRHDPHDRQHDRYDRPHDQGLAPQ